MTEMSLDVEFYKGKVDDMRKTYDSSDYTTNTLKSDVTEITIKVYNMKTALFEHTNDIATLKSGQKTMQTHMDDLIEELTKMQSVDIEQEVKLGSLRTDMVNIKTSMSSISASILSFKSMMASTGEMDNKMTVLTTNITTIKTQLTTVKQSLSGFGPDLLAFQSDLQRYKDSMNGLSNKMASMSDPSRFSCAVTTDEIRVPGVITYSTCNVNTEAMMNKNTGHISIRDSGDYFLSFTANMVSVNSQAVWCAIYKQSPGNDGWQVLGKIIQICFFSPPTFPLSCVDDPGMDDRWEDLSRHGWKS
jgi:predicted  nucleic acid-binding Zn-ribbon protein